jgi:predicted RNA-binding Zn-ribbon protein involved in translation (DUF1610 family)
VSGYILINYCPACDGEIEFEQWCDDFPCPHCGVQLQHTHDCEEEDCYDYLELADG